MKYFDEKLPTNYPLAVAIRIYLKRIALVMAIYGVSILALLLLAPYGNQNYGLARFVIDLLVFVSMILGMALLLVRRLTAKTTSREDNAVLAEPKLFRRKVLQEAETRAELLQILREVNRQLVRSNRIGELKILVDPPVAIEIGDEERRVKALLELAPHLPPELLVEALAVAREIGNELRRVQVLLELAPHLSPELLAEALVVAREIGDEWLRAWTLAKLAPHLPPELLLEALAAVREIGNEQSRVQALIGLAPHLPGRQREGVLTEALAAVREIGNERSRVRALAGLAPHLSPELLAEALAVAREIGHEEWRVQALTELAPHLLEGQCEGVLAEALAMAREIWEEEWRIEVLTKLAPHLPPELLAEALAMAREIQERIIGRMP